MRSNLSSEALIVATISLVAMPLLARRVRAAFRPVELTRFNAATMSSGVVLMIFALVVCAVPAIVAIAGGPMPTRHFFPGNSIGGWVSAGLAALLIVMMAIGYRRVRKIEDRLRVEPSIGKHRTFGEFDLVVLSASQPLAYAVGGRHSQVVITEGLVEQLSVPELVSVVEHEAAHLSLNHRRHLTLVGMLEPAASWFFPMRWLVDALRSALEHAADSRTTDWSATRRALVTVSGAPAVAGVAAFTAGNLVDRLDALGGQRTATDASIRTMMYASALLLGGISLATLVVFWL